MSLDVGMVGKTINAGVAKVLEDAGEGAGLTATLTADLPRRNGGQPRRLTWAGTGNQWHSSPTTKTVAAGSPIVFTDVPPTNSADWRLDGATPVLDGDEHVFRYTLTVQAKVGARNLTLLSISFVLSEDDPEVIDVDTLIEAATTTGSTINVVDQWSALVEAAEAAATSAEASAASMAATTDGAMAPVLADENSVSRTTLDGLYAVIGYDDDLIPYLREGAGASPGSPVQYDTDSVPYLA